MGEFQIGSETISVRNNAIETSGNVTAGTPAAYRTGVVAADVMAAPGTVTCTKQAGGSVDAGTHYVKVVAVNAHGRSTATAGNTTVTTETTNLTIRAAFAAVTGATHYDIYCSTAADPLWVGRVTEAQRASGIVIDAVGSTAAGGTANAVDIGEVGTGLAAGVTAATNTGYIVPASPVNCAGYQYIDWHVACTRTGDAVAPALTVAPMLYDGADYSQGTAYAHSFGGASGVLGSMRFVLRTEVRGYTQAALVVQSIAGTGMSVTVKAVLS